jgi:excisionase family DNA binding protein
MKEIKPWLTASEAAALVSVSKRTIQRRIADKALEAHLVVEGNYREWQVSLESLRRLYPDSLDACPTPGSDSEPTTEPAHPPMTDSAALPALVRDALTQALSGLARGEDLDLLRAQLQADASKRDAQLSQELTALYELAKAQTQEIKELRERLEERARRPWWMFWRR